MGFTTKTRNLGRFSSRTNPFTARVSKIKTFLTFFLLSEKEHIFFLRYPQHCPQVETRSRMASPASKPYHVTSPLYSIYIYHRPENCLEGQSDWERRSMTDNFHSAMQEALRLTRSQNFKKVEIRAQRTHPKTAHITDNTVHIFTPRNKGFWRKVFSFFWMVA